MSKTNIFSQSSIVSKNETVGPEGTTPESVRDALSKLITALMESNNKENVST